ncbi:cell surface protein [Liquorilactobacillus ghanensis DSM 18630]|uniref:Cell surface protein n=1 Tax=Liquorilactobacillus ghanensis DSM 18630 TaxID=1423750 RepID=A0A0R1VJZ1_9LACO|nr:L,D-transpeptidase [Liquorilactobacillus ghanensis]KRM05583.1 cell surface protein [Liquorilactobacillus ghanensis DSM 18630]
MKKGRILAWIVAVIFVILAGWSYIYVKHSEQRNAVRIEKAAQKSKQKKVDYHSQHLRYPISWRKSSQTTQYPKAAAIVKLSVKVSLSAQRVYIMSGKKIIYTMYAATTRKTKEKAARVPKGTYKIEAKQGEFFFNPQTGQGGKYWVSWKGEGKHLFQTVPTDAQKHYLTSEARLLGKKAAVNTHGNIWLSVKDAKWFYNNIPRGTKVVVGR